jgi:uncharacterized protein
MLLSEQPDCTLALEIMERDKHLAPSVAQRVLYEVVAQINAALFPPITKLELIHTEGCNLACEYCFEKDMLGYRRMPYDVGRKAIDLLFDYSQNQPDVTITHFGGEPTVNFRAIRAITEYAEQKAKLLHKTATFSMTSNGVLIDDAKAEYCAGHKIMVLLSIDGLRETHDRYRLDKRGRGTFDQAMKGLRALKKTQQWVGVKMTVMPDNANNLFNDVLGLYNLGVNQFLIGYATGIKWPDRDMRTYTEQWHKVYLWYRAMPRDDLRIADFDELDQRENKSVFGCQAGNDSITVAVNGEISPCSKILALNNRDIMLKLGDVHHGLTHLRNRLELTSTAKLIAACEEEGIAQSYQGGCWATNYSDNLNVFQPSMQDYEFQTLRRSACAGYSACK